MVQDDGQLQARLARAMRETRRSRGLETALAVGGAVLDGWFGGDLERWRSGVGDRTLRALARDARIAVSASTLYRFVAITALCRRMGRTRFDHLGTSHLRQVLPLPAEEQVEIVTRAEAERWTVKRLADEVRGRLTRGDDSPPGFLEALPHLRRWADHPGRLGGLDAVAGLPPDERARLAAWIGGCRSELERLQRALGERP